MSAAVQVVIGVMMLSFVLTYAWWVRMRVWILRQDLFTARGELWDAMRTAGTLDDPGHRQLRDAINALIRVAPLISVFSMMRVIAEGAHRAQGLDLASYPAKVREIHDRITSRLFRYFFFESLLGIFAVIVALFLGLAILMPVTFVRSYLHRMVGRLLDSSELIAFGRLADPIEPLMA